MIELKLSTIDEIIEGEMAERGHWMVANIKGNYFWPIRKQSYVFKGTKFWIFPLTEKFYPAVTMRLNGPSYADPQSKKLLMKFISALAWSNGCGYMVEGIGGGSLPQPEGISQTFLSMRCEQFDFFKVPETNDRNSLLALALMREGRALNHPGFAFLNFYRVFEAIFSNNGGARSNWVRENWQRSQRVNAQIDEKYLEMLFKRDVAIYFDARRKMASHAKVEPIYNPDEPEIWRQFHLDKKLMESIAELAIEEHLSIETTWSKRLRLGRSRNFEFNRAVD